MSRLPPPTAVEYLEAERERQLRWGAVRRVRGGRLVTNPEFVRLLSANQLLVGATDPPVSWAELSEQTEPTFRSLRTPGRRVTVFGDEAQRRLGPSLEAEGYRERPVSVLSFRGVTSVEPNPRVDIRLVDPFILPARYALQYRLEEERWGPAPEASEAAALVMQDPFAGGRRGYAAMMGPRLAAACDLVQTGSLRAVVNLGTAPEWRGQQIASTLVLHVTANAFKDEARGVFTTTHSRNLAEGFLRPIGYERVAGLFTYDKPPRAGG